MFSYDRIRIHARILARITPYLSCFIIDVASMYLLTGLVVRLTDLRKLACDYYAYGLEAITSGFVF